MDSGMRAFNPFRFEFNSKFPEGCFGQESDKDWWTQWLKHFDNKDGDNSPCINNQIILYWHNFQNILYLYEQQNQKFQYFKYQFMKRN